MQQHSVKKTTIGGLTTALVLLTAVAFLLAWPVPIEPIAWQAPLNPGYSDKFAANERLASLELLPIGDNHGPEGIALDAQGRIYAATAEGRIVRLAADGTQPENWADTGGRPLGLEFDPQGNLIVADAFRGLLLIDPDRQVKVLATEADGIPIRYANELAVAADGRIYFSDSSVKFGARDYGGTYEASLLDIMEHGGHGRVLVYDPATAKATTFSKGLNFPNGVAISPDQSYLLVVETGAYRLLRYWLTGPRQGQSEVFIDTLPGFPDNLSTGRDGRYWLALIAPRNPLLDKLADKPDWRKLIQRLPEFMRPKVKSYGHVLALNGDGQVVLNLQDPAGGYPLITAAVEGSAFLYLGSLTAPTLGRLAKTKLRF